MTAQQQRAAKAFHVRSYYGMDGLGDARPITQAVGAGLLSAGGVIAAIPGGQLPGAIVAAVGALTTLIGSLFVPDLTKIQATRIVDQIEAQVLQPTVANWRALSADQKTRTMQAAYAEVIEAALRKVQEGCSNPALGEAGQRCISERLIRGGAAPWCPTGTGCDWYALYLDPIMNDSNVIPDTALTGSIDSAVTDLSSALGGISPLWIGVGLVAFAFVAVSD